MTILLSWTNFFGGEVLQTDLPYQTTLVNSWKKIAAILIITDIISLQPALSLQSICYKQLIPTES